MIANDYDQSMNIYQNSQFFVVKDVSYYCLSLSTLRLVGESSLS